MRKIIIAIDGFSSCGKSSFAKVIANKYNYVFIDTGAMYRAVTLYAINNGYISDEAVNKEYIIMSLPDINISLIANNKENIVLLNNKDVSNEIRSMEVNRYVSIISSIAEVRTRMVALQQEMGKKKGIVMDGRDIGTVVFPNAELKIFMTASNDVRAKRRYDELLAKGDKVSMAEVKDNINERDLLDQTRAESPLRRADDAIILDNSNMTIEQQMVWLEGVLEKL